MKKIFLILVVCILAIFAVTASAESIAYEPGLDMTMDAFISKYNAIGSALDSPIIALKFPMEWTTFQDKNVAWFKADKETNITVLLMSADTGSVMKTSAGLDEIQIFGEAKYFPALITIAKRCASVFAEDLFGISTASFVITEAISYYYENNLDSMKYYSYYYLDNEQKYTIQFWRSGGTEFYFSIKNGM